MPDVLGWRKKFGVLIPSSNTVVEPDFYAMVVPGVTAHACRIWIDSGPREGQEAGQEPRTVASETQPAVQRLLTSDPDYLIMGINGPTFRGGVESNRKWKEIRPIYGKGKLSAVLQELGWNQVNTSAIERFNGTSRQRDRRKARKTLAFSKEGRYHRWMSWLSTTLYNFCRSHRSLKQGGGSEVHHRSPAMAAGLTDHIWSVREWLRCPVLVRG